MKAALTKNLFLCGTLACVAAFGMTAHAAEGDDENLSLTASASVETNSAGASELAITIEDAKDLPNACDYYVNSFQYKPAAQTIEVEVQKDPCFVDRYGKGKAVAKWVLPGALRNQSSLCITINQKRYGMLSITETGASVEYRPTAVCL